MDMLNILVNPNNIKSVCFLCYKQSENTTSLHENIEIHDEYFSLNLTLWNIMKKLFPSHDLFLPQACEDCASLIIKMFSLLQRNYFKNEMLNNLVNNINEEVDIKTECARKPKKYKLKVNILTTESLVNHPTKLFNSIKCTKCDMKFKSKVLLQKHIKITHKNTNEAIICDICGKIFNKSATLKVHLSSHKEKQCPYCFKVLKSHSHFNLHLKNHKVPIKRKRRIKYHCCGNCDYRSINKNTLEAHINKVHLKIRPFLCQICQKGFYKKSNLTQHFVTHEKTKDKTCEICGDTFVNEKTLIEHLMLHSGQKPFKCEICGADFITSGRRLEHMKRKHMEKAECCVVCDKKFSLKKDLNSHLKHVHGAENYILKLEDEQTELQVFVIIPMCKGANYDAQLAIKMKEMDMGKEIKPLEYGERLTSLEEARTFNKSQEDIGEPSRLSRDFKHSSTPSTRCTTSEPLPKLNPWFLPTSDEKNRDKNKISSSEYGSNQKPNSDKYIAPSARDIPKLYVDDE